MFQTYPYPVPAAPTTFEQLLSLTLEQILAGAIFMLLGFLLGFSIERVVLVQLRRRSLLPSQIIERVVIPALDGVLTLLSTCAGVYVAILYAPFGEGLQDLLLRLLQIPVILALTLFFMRLGSNFIDYSSQEGRRGSVVAVSLSRSVLRLTIVTIGILLLLQALGVSITPAIATLGIGGLAVSLALEETLSNVISGIYLLVSRQIQPGDYVRLKVDERDHIEGYITDITWRSTKIRMQPGRMLANESSSTVVVPNLRMAADIVVIHHRLRIEREIAVQASIPLRDPADMERIERESLDIAIEVWQEVIGRPPAIEPFVRFQSFGLQQLDLMVVMYGDERVDPHRMRHELIKRLLRHFRGVSLPPPLLPPSSPTQPPPQSE